MTALDPVCSENAAEAPSPKWTSERVAFITEQYLIYRKSGGEIARMLGPAFTRNSVTGKLFRTGALRQEAAWAFAAITVCREAPVSATQDPGPGRSERMPSLQLPRNPWKRFLSLSPAAPISSK